MSRNSENLPVLFTQSETAPLPVISATHAPASEHPTGTPITHYLWIIRKQAWKLAVFVLTSLLVTFLISSRLTPIYESSALISIDRQAPTGVVGSDAESRGGGAGAADADIYMATQMRIVLSDAVLRPVAERFNLLEREKALEKLTAQQKAARKDAPILLRQLKVVRPTLTYLIRINYRSTSARLSADVANAIARSYLEHLSRLRMNSSTNASGLLSRQLEELKAKMERSGQALAQFEKELNVISPEEKTNMLSQRLLQLNTEYTTAQADRVKNEAIYNSLKSNQLEAIQTSGQGEPLVHLQERINEAQEKFADLRATKGPNHPDYKKAQGTLMELQAQFETAKASVTERVGIEYKKAQAREEMLGRTLAETKAEADKLNLHSIDYQRLKQDAEADKNLYQELIKKTQEAGINATFQNSTTIADLARPAAEPVFPDMRANLLLAGILSLILGIATVILLDSIDTSVRDPEQIQRLYQTDLLGTLPLVRNNISLVPALSVPALPPGEEGPKTAIAKTNSVSSFEEAIRMVRNSIILADFDRRLRSILFTSATPGEGKSTAAMYIAMAHAEQGKKTLLIDADLRRPTLDKKLGINDPGPGISGVLLGDATWESAIIQMPLLPNLHVLPAGKPSRRSSDLIGSSVNDLLDETTAVYDLVILDGPPILGFAEPMQLAIAVDGTVIVAVAGETNRKAIGAVVGTLRRLRANIIGIVLNRTSNDKGDGYYYYYRYYDYYRYSGKSATAENVEVKS